MVGDEKNFQNPTNDWFSEGESNIGGPDPFSIVETPIKKTYEDKYSKIEDSVNMDAPHTGDIDTSWFSDVDGDESREEVSLGDTDSTFDNLDFTGDGEGQEDTGDQGHDVQVGESWEPNDPNYFEEQLAETNEELEIEAMAALQDNVFLFIEDAWGEVAQPIKPEWRDHVTKLYTVSAEEWKEHVDALRPEMFEDFVYGQHLTWQQTVLCIAYNRALSGTLPRRLAIGSGRGIGKSSIIARLILHFLCVFPLSKVPCTAPTSDQMFAALWSELSLQVSRMSDKYRNLYEWQSDHIRMREHPAAWFARAKTSSKGQSEALSGIHADHMLAVVDEASAVESQVFQTAEATMTNANNLIILISNTTRDSGYFFDCFHKDKDNWVRMVFNAEYSPIVDRATIARTLVRYGKDSNEYRASVLGLFPKTTAIDPEGWYRLFNDKWIDDVMPSTQPVWMTEDLLGRVFLGVDPSGEGSDEAAGYLRAGRLAKLGFSIEVPEEGAIVRDMIKVQDVYQIDEADMVTDNFGVGANLEGEFMAQAKTGRRITAKNVGDKCEDDGDREYYLNERARCYDAMYQWGNRGGRIVYDDVMREELKTIYVRNQGGKFQVMPKREMRKRGYKSPNRTDACMLTFVEDYQASATYIRQNMRPVVKSSQQSTNFNRHSFIPRV